MPPGSDLFSRMPGDWAEPPAVASSWRGARRMLWSSRHGHREVGSFFLFVRFYYSYIQKLFQQNADHESNRRNRSRQPPNPPSLFACISKIK